MYYFCSQPSAILAHAVLTSALRYAGLDFVMENQLSQQWEMLLGSGVRMKTVVRGDGVAPELGSLVLFNWIGRVLHEDDAVGDMFAEREGVTARIGDGDEIPGQISHWAEFALYLCALQIEQLKARIGSINYCCCCVVAYEYCTGSPFSFFQFFF